MGSLARVASLGIVALSLFAAAPVAKAGTVDLSAYGWMAFTDDNVDLTVISQSSNGLVVSLQKFADFTSNEPLSIVFRQTSATAVSKIAIEEETVVNDSGTTWSGFQFLLNGGVAGSNPSFDVAGSASFSTAPFGTKSYNADNTVLTLSGGSLSSGTFPSNLWTPGRASGALIINANPLAGSADQSFVFTEQPVTVVPIPLPAAAWTSLSGLVAVGLLVSAKKAKQMFA
jgi:hypothetical protein